MLRIKVAFVFLGALSGLIASESSGQCSSSTLYSKEFEAGNPIDGGESVALDLSGFAGTTVALNFDWVVPECFTGPGHLEFTNIAMNGTCLPSDFIFTSAFGDLSQPYWDGCVGNITMDGCPSDIAPAVGTMSVSVLVPLEQENILTFNLDWVSLNEGNEPRLFSISTGCNSESEEADCTDCAGSNTLFNPDYNGDGFIGVDDILGVLSFYDNAWDGPVSPSWSCGEAITYSGVGYSTVQIGDQCWFAENLSTTTYLNGDAIPQNLSNGGWSSTTSGAMAFYDNVPTNSGLYNFYAVNESRGLCPSGWHVPTDGEWTIMIDHLGECPWLVTDRPPTAGTVATTAPIRAGSQVCRAATATMMAPSTTLEATEAGGVPRPLASADGIVTCTTTSGMMSTAAATLHDLAFLFVAFRMPSERSE